MTAGDKLMRSLAELKALTRQVREMTRKAATTAPTDSDIRHVLEEALSTQFGAEGVSIWVEDVISMQSMVVFRKVNADGDSQLWIVEYEISEEQRGVNFGEPKGTMRVTRYEFDDGSDPIEMPTSATPVFRELSEHHKDDKEDKDGRY